LRRNGIHARRYFYPLISDFPIYSSGSSSSRQNLPVAARAADEVICLPIYPDLPQEEVVRIAEIVVAASASRPRE
jgi:dTDP-4-amino-4,6-dideoxygalactose transaminase